MYTFGELLNKIEIVRFTDGTYKARYSDRMLPVLVAMARSQGYFLSRAELDCGKSLHFSLQQIDSILAACDGVRVNVYSSLLRKRYNSIGKEEDVQKLIELV